MKYYVVMNLVRNIPVQLLPILITWPIVPANFYSTSIFVFHFTERRSGVCVSKVP